MLAAQGQNAESRRAPSCLDPCSRCTGTPHCLVLPFTADTAVSTDQRPAASACRARVSAPTAFAHFLSLSRFGHSPNISTFSVIVVIITVIWKHRRWLACFSDKVFLNQGVSFVCLVTMLLHTSQTAARCKHNLHTRLETTQVTGLALLQSSGTEPALSWRGA